MRPVLARVLSVCATVLLAYVVYAHATSCRQTREALDEPVAIRFDGASWASGLDVRTEGGVTASAAASRLHLAGTTSDASGKLARFEVKGPTRRLREAALHLRLRVHNASEVDVGIGLERADAGGGATRVAFGLRADPKQPSWRLFGDERADLPRVGDEFERQRFVAFAGPDDEHDVVLRVVPELDAVLGSVDGVPVSSHVAGWEDGVPVRPIVFLRGRSPGQPIDVDLVAADYEPEHLPERAIAVDERFDAKILDPRTWHVLEPDGWNVAGDFALLGKDGGARLEGHALRAVRDAQVVALTGASAPLASFRATVRFHVVALHHARFFFGVTNLMFGVADWRAFDVGLADGPTQIEPYVAGHWEGDAQFNVTSMPGVGSGVTDGELTVEYDAETGRATAALNGRTITEQRSDFQPPERVQLHVGTRVDDVEGKVDVRVREVRFEPLSGRLGEAIAATAAPPPPLDASRPGFFDDFASDSSSTYHVLSGKAEWLPERRVVKLGPATYGYSEVVRGFFDQPVTVTGSVFVPGDPERGDYDSAGVMATDHAGTTRWLAVIWYGAKLKPELHLTKQVTGHDDQWVAFAQMKLAPGKSYWVKMLVDRRNVYARAWPSEAGAVEPETWMVSAPLDEGWRATGGVGFAGNAATSYASPLRAE